MTTENQDRSLLEQAADLFVYAPLGAALVAREALPDLVRRGRQQATSQATMARMLGEFAVRQGRTEVGKAYVRAREQATATLQTLGVLPPSPDGRTAAAPPRPRPSPPPGEQRQAPAGPPAESLPIPDYDSLSASQVVPRLAGLRPDELGVVREYEAANRSRKTILNRIAQLTS